MFKKIGKSAETLASEASVSRRGFFGRFARLAGGAALGVMALATPKATAAFPPYCYRVFCGCLSSDRLCRRNATFVCHRAC
ncbi:MAG: hypothetical protein ACJ8FY_20855 [Gemmataceae bacterium]